MITAWTAHLKDQEEIEKFQQGLLHARWIFERQKEILTSIEKGLDRQEMSPRVYDKPGWTFRQAHSNGYRQCINDIKTLINLDQKDKI